jgi:hypothetical protein
LEAHAMPSLRKDGAKAEACPRCGGETRQGRVLDPFSGSGTTVAAALTLGRNGVGCDIRVSQCELGRKRLQSGVQGELV